MSTSRRTAARRRGKRTPQKRDDDQVAAWIVGHILLLPAWVLGQLGRLWAELESHQRRELQGLGLVGLASVLLVSVLGARTPLHPAVWWAVGLGWPLLVGGLVVGGALLIHPPKRPPQRLQVVAVAVLAWVLLAALSLASAPAGGALGQVGPLLARAIGAGWTALLLVVVATLAVVLAARLRMAGAVAHAARAAGLARAPEKPWLSGGPVRDAVRRPAAGADDQVAEDGPADPRPAAEVEELADDDEEGPEGRPAMPAPAVPVPDEWELPGLDLLDAPHGRTPRQEAETRRQVAKIESKLGQQKIGARVVAVNDGPSVTQYVVELDEGVLVKQVVALQNDLSLALAASPLRIQAPIPGMSAIGIEVPKARRRVVALRELLEVEALAAAGLVVGLGADVGAGAVLGDLTQMPHLLVAGATGQGKSVFINALVASLLLRHSPATLRLLMIDPKRVELIGYAGLPHLACPVIVEPDQAQEALGWAVGEMDRRYKVLAAEGVRNIAAYNERVAARGERPMPFVVVVIDELADLMMVSRAEAQAERRAGCAVEERIVRLAQLARAVGIHLVIATQRPSVDVITGLIKANVPSRVAFTVASGTDSRVILDAVGAEKLMGKGDLLYQPVDGPQVRLQGAYLEDREVDVVVEHWRRQGRPDYLGGLYPEPDVAAAARAARAGGDDS
jgi:S-DNA-T family DNA segregation ATPase FtsK/SpoIIIE